MVLSRRVSDWNRTLEFHQAVLGLTRDYSDSKLAWDISQHVLDRVWQDESGNSQETAKASEAVISYCCQACGFGIHPGWNGTTLRVKRFAKPKSIAAKRTLKRRALRQKRKALLQQAQASKHHQARRNASSETQGTVELRLLRDDATIEPLDRNHLVLKCGRCGDKTLLKGLKREPQVSSKKQPPPQVAFSKVSNSSNGSRNFEQLPKLAATNVSPSAQSLRETPNKKSTLLEQKLGTKSKKKKKPPSKKSGNLMDFLSSLNNH